MHPGIVGKRLTSAGHEMIFLALEGYLVHSARAGFNSKDRESCSDSTRANILADIFEWIHSDSQSGPLKQRKSADLITYDARILWMNGSAGTGKTTIAYTVAKRAWDSDPKVLGASFFCSRDVECSNLALIFPTISYQLGMFNPLFATQVSRILAASPDIGYASVHYQLQELIVRPLPSVRESFTPCVIIIDALDECKDTATISTVLSALSRYALELFPLKFLITSRPETHIQMGFESPTLRSSTTQLVLHQLSLPVVQGDIETYLWSRLSITRRLYKIQKPWPTPTCVDALARLSSGLFIFASTSVKFIEDPFYSDPRSQLALLLDTTGRATEKSSPSDRLDNLYTEFLSLAYPNISHHHLRVLKTVLGSILHIRDLLSPSALENLLGLSTGRVRETLLRLQSIIIVPDDDKECIRLIHPSFFDFLADPARCSIPCFAVTDLATRITAYIPTHVQYATRHWAYHVSEALVTDILFSALDKFCSEHLLHWIEVCSLLGELRQALLSVGELYRDLLYQGQRQGC
ncbi:hypothetical protein DFH09DRAFT_1444506 [Mycena vulgaris]|nr:hypothetical protein DFH09DRAFT_1444506 [Mycena vulgaris]